MRYLYAMLLALSLIVPAVADDRWHRDETDGQDLYNEHGVVVGMVRHEGDHWIAIITKKAGGEDWIKLGNYRLMAEAKSAVKARTGVKTD